MELYRKALRETRNLAVFPGAFHPPTNAHLALARAAREGCDEVVFVLPRAFPHKAYDGVGLEDRLAMLRAATADEPDFSVGVSEGGLFIEIIRECRAAYGEAPRLWLLCGRDAAARFLEWDYGDPGLPEAWLSEFELLVAPRGGPCRCPAALRGKIHDLPLVGEWDEQSSTLVRERVVHGEPWRHLVPAGIETMVERFYRHPEAGGGLTR